MSLSVSIYFLLLPLMLAMTHFSVGVSNSAEEGSIKPGTPLKAALLFAIFTFVMSLLGSYAARLLQPRMEYPDHYIAFALLLLIAIRILMHAFQKKVKTKIFDVNHLPVIFALALALSFNMLFAGVAIYYLGLSPFNFALTLAGVVLLLSFSGLLYGSQFGENTGWKAELVSGFLIIALGIFVMGWH